MENTKPAAGDVARKKRVLVLIRFLIFNYALCLVLVSLAHYLELTSWSYSGVTIWFLSALAFISFHMGWISRQPSLSKSAAQKQGYVGQAYWVILFFWAALATNELRELVLLMGLMSIIYLILFANLMGSLSVSILASILYLAAASVGEHWLEQSPLSSKDLIWLAGFLAVSVVCSALAGTTFKQRKAASAIKKSQLRHARDLMIQSEKLAAMGQMVASIGHEIANPASAARVATSLMEERLAELEHFSMALFDEDDLDEDTLRVRDEMIRQFGALRSGLTTSMQATDKLKDLSHALRTQSRMETKVTEGVDLNKVVKESIVLVSGRTIQHQLEESLAEIPEIQCMRSRIGQVVTNLLANAADALTERSDELGTDFEGKIAISSQAQSHDGTDGVSIVIADNGTGVPEAIREKIFEEFFTTKPAGVGTGLGLAMCASIVRDHGGSLQVTDDPALGGARFEVWLPMVATVSDSPQLH